jgi:hypothetical protein
VEILGRKRFSVKWAPTATPPSGSPEVLVFALEGRNKDQRIGGSVVSRPPQSRNVELETARDLRIGSIGDPRLSLRKTVIQRDQPICCGAAVMEKDFDMESGWITELGKTRGDEYTSKILEYVQELEESSTEPFIPLLTDLALARVLIVHLTLRYGPERGPQEARIAFETTLEQLKPILERYYREKGTPPR